MAVNIYRKQVFDDFTSVDGWVGAVNCATAGYGPSRNTTSTYVKTGKSSMRVYFDHDAGTAGNVIKTYSSTYDFSLYDEVWVNVYVDDLNDLDDTSDQALMVRFGNDASNYIHYYVDQSELKTGWNLIKLTLNSPDAVTGAPDLSAVDWLWIQSYDNSVSDYSLYFDSIWLMKKLILHNTFGPIQLGLSGNVSSHNIPYCSRPRLQVGGRNSPAWTMSAVLLNAASGNALYGSEYDRVLSASILEDYLLKPCVIEPDLTSNTIEFRDDDGASNADAALDATTDYFRKWVYVPTVSNLKTATLYVYLKENASNPPQDADTVDVKVNGVWHVGVWDGTDTTSSYAWLSVALDPGLLREGNNEVQLRGVGVSASDIFNLGTDKGSDYQRSHYSTDSGSAWTNATGEYMVYLACTFEHHSQLKAQPTHIIPYDISFQFNAGKVNVLQCSMMFLEEDA